MGKNLNDEKKQLKKNKKDEQLDQFRVDDSKESLTTNQGLKMAEDEFSLKAGERGPTLMEDFHFIEKIAHFDHEIEVDHNFDTTDAVLYDALYIVGGENLSKTFKKEMKKFVNKTFDHYKAIGATQKGTELLERLGMTSQTGVIAGTDYFTDTFIQAVAKYRHYDRDVEDF